VADRIRYRAKDVGFCGVGEHEPLDFHSPYGCSKGAADQYVRDYGRIYGLPTVVFRMSCIAGPRQFGNEDQGWVAHFLYSALDHQPISVYGNGLQVRDVLHVHDLVDAMAAAYDAGTRCHGQVYNLGGGMARSVSVLEMLHMIEDRLGEALVLHHGPVRAGDQPLYVSDTSRFRAHTGWQPQRSVAQTLGSIHEFWQSHRLQIGSVRHRAGMPEVTEEVA
jgi:CDP-paratose 2-epimerase